MRIILTQLFQYLLKLNIRLVMMHIDKVIMVLYRETTPFKHGVMMVGCIYLNTFLLRQNSICFLLLPKLPYIYITTRSVLRVRPV